MIGYKIINVEEQTYRSGSGIKITFLVDDTQRFLVVFSNQDAFEKASKIKPGDVVELDLEQDGKYLKLNDIGNVIIDENQLVKVPEVKKQVNTYGRTSPEERDSIQRQTAIKAAVELIAGSGIKFKTIDEVYQESIKIAEGFYDFIADIKKSKEEV